MTGIAQVAAFDLDGTVLSGQSGGAWAFHLARRRLITARLATRVAVLLVRYRLGAALDYERIAREILGPFKGIPIARFEQLLDGFVAERLVPRLRADGYATMRRLRDEGCHIVLASAAIDPIVERVARYLPVDGWVATRLSPPIDGAFAGSLDGPVRHGAAKITAVDAYARPRLGPWHLSHAFTDHESDLALLEAADRPHAVNASPGLRRIAKARGWPLLVWR